MDQFKSVNPPVTTFSLIKGRDKSKTLFQLFWELHKLREMPDLQFWKFLWISDNKGVRLKPDLTKFGLIAVWGSEKLMIDFFNSSPVFSGYRKNIEEIWTIQMLSVQSEGEWSGLTPFLRKTKISNNKGPVAMVTNESIQWLKLWRFWQNVPKADEGLNSTNGLIASINFTDMPVFKHGTFSLWENANHLQAFILKDKMDSGLYVGSAAANWHREKILVQFKPVDSWGQWNGIDPLERYLNKYQTYSN